MSPNLRRHWTLSFLYALSTLSSFLATAVGSAFLPASSYMTSYYWLQGPQVAFFLFDFATLWIVARGHERFPGFGNTRNRFALWTLVAVSGLLFLPGPLSERFTPLGIVVCLLTAEAMRFYLERLARVRATGDFIAAQRFPRNNGLLRLGGTAVLAALAHWHVLPSWFRYDLALAGVFAGGHWLAAAMHPVASAPAPSFVRGFANPATAATFLLGALATRALPPTVTHLVSARWQPLSTVLTAGVLAASGLLLQLLLDQHRHRQETVARVLPSAIALATLAAMALLACSLISLPPLLHCAAVSLAAATTTSVGLFALLFGPWGKKGTSPFALLLVASAYFVQVLLPSDLQWASTRFYSGAILSLLLALIAMHPRTAFQRVPELCTLLMPRFFRRAKF